MEANVPLTDVKIRNAKPIDRHVKMFDGGGLFLLITPKGRKGWRFKYRFNDKEKLLSFGIYPTISLSDARSMRDEARKLVAKGIDPSSARKEEKQARASDAQNTFEVVAREWHDKNYNSWVPKHGDQILRRLEMNIFPYIGSMPIAHIRPLDLLRALQKIELRGANESARRIKQNCGQIFRFAVSSGRAERDISTDIRDALAPVISSNHSAIVNENEVGGLLRAIDSYDGYKVVKYALQLSPHVFVRPGELRRAEWTEIDFEKAEWNIPAHRMKMKKPHLVPLSGQAVEILKELNNLTGTGRYLFPGVRSPERPISDNTLNAALRRLGYDKSEMTVQGFRAMARTILDEILEVRVDFIEHQLAHIVRDANGRAYNRTKYLKQRRAMMQKWSDFLDNQKKSKLAL
jgi:integrase